MKKEAEKILELATGPVDGFPKPRFFAENAGGGMLLVANCVENIAGSALICAILDTIGQICFASTTSTASRWIFQSSE